MAQIGQTETYEAKKELLSDFNEAKFQILRLHTLWTVCNHLSNMGKLTQWKWKLDTISRELSPDALSKDIDKEDDKKYSTKLNELNKNIAEAEKIRDRNAIYEALQEKEVFLRCLQDQVGKGSKRSSTEEDDIDE